FAACQPCRAASICGLFFSASSSNSESDAAATACGDADSCAKTRSTGKTESRMMQRLGVRATNGNPVGGFFRASNNIFVSWSVRNEAAGFRRRTEQRLDRKMPRVRVTVKTEKETNGCVTAPFDSGSDQEGGVKRVQLG